MSRLSELLQAELLQAEPPAAAPRSPERSSDSERRLVLSTLRSPDRMVLRTALQIRRRLQALTGRRWPLDRVRRHLLAALADGQVDRRQAIVTPWSTTDIWWLTRTGRS